MLDSENIVKKWRGFRILIEADIDDEGKPTAIVYTAQGVQDWKRQVVLQNGEGIDVQVPGYPSDVGITIEPRAEKATDLSSVKLPQLDFPEELNR